MSYASSVRKGVLAAARLHRDLGTETKIRHDGGSIDIVEAAYRVKLAVLFRPLDGLLGAFMRTPSPGALITTKRSLAVQRLTLAHELGHFVLGHNPSLDSENILRRAAIPNSGVDEQEVEADAFAFEFMMPRWLIQYHCQKQAWTIDDLKRPFIVYQLSLRLGGSYEATCRTLNRNRLLNETDVERLLAARPRSIKQELLGDYIPKDYRGDVWLLTKRDNNDAVGGNYYDFFVVRLEEASGAGYLWSYDNSARLSTVDDRRLEIDEGGIGSDVLRVITVSSDQKQSGHLSFSERQPWMTGQEPARQFVVRYDLYGPEEGVPESERRRRLEAA